MRLSASGSMWLKIWNSEDDKAKELHFADVADSWPVSARASTLSSLHCYQCSTEQYVSDVFAIRISHQNFPSILRRFSFISKKVNNVIKLASLMLKIILRDAIRFSNYEILQGAPHGNKPTSNCSLRRFSKVTGRVRPVKLAYSSYESTDIDVVNDTEKCPVMIMHGLLGSKNNWNTLSKTIHSRTMHKIMSVDARNHGDSPQTQDFNYPCLAEDIRCLMTDLKIPKINAIGHSMGGRTMMYLALKYPHLINSLIVVDISPVRTTHAIHDLTTLLDAMLSVKFEHNIPLSKARKIVDQQLAEIVPDLFVRQFLLTNMIETEGGRYKWRVNLDSLIGNFSAIANFKPPNKKFSGPVLFIGGAKSTFLSEEDHAGILNYFPNSEFRYIQDAGHWVHTEKPEEFLDLVCNFLND